MSAPIPQSNFTVGEITHRMAGAITLDQYGLSLTRARNVHILPQGPLRKRSGYFFITPTKFQPGSGKETVFWIDFIFNKNQAYAIEVGDKYFRFYTNGGRVMSGGSPYEVVTPYLAAHVKDLKFTQINDIIYITHQSYPVNKLKRIAETNWALTPITYVDGPYLDINKTETVLNWPQTFKPGGSGSPSEAWDSNNVVSSQGHGPGPAPFFTYTFSGSNEFAVNGYTIEFTGYEQDGAWTESIAKGPRAWTFQGQKNGSSVWVTLDQRSSEADWIPGQTRYFEFTNLNEVKYHAYRLAVTAMNGGDECIIWDIRLKMQNITDTFSFSSTVGINDDVGLKSTDVGRYIRFQGPDGFWRYVIITSITNTTTFQGKFYGLWFNSASNSSKWRLGAFSPTTGYPAAVALFEERLALAGTLNNPRTLYLTRTGDFENFIPENVLTDAGPITITLTGEYLDAIKWLSPGKGLFAGTAGGVTSISGGNDPLTYKNIKQVSQTNYGAASTRPIRVGPALLFQAVFANCVRELLYNFSDDAYDAPDITFLNEHLYRNQLIPAWLESPDEHALTPMGSGIMGVLTYVRAQKIYGSTAYETDGKFMSVCTIPNTAKRRSDQYVAVQRVIGGVVKQYVEYGADPFEYQEMSEACFLDSALSYTGSPVSILSGLSHLEGKEVTVTGFLAGESSPKIYRKTVTGAQITLDSPLNNAKVGLKYISEIEILRSRANRPDQTTSFASRLRIDYVAVDMFRTAGLTINTPGFQTKDQVVQRGTTDEMNAGPPLFTGKKVVPIEGSWQDGGVMSLWSEDPLPAMIRVIMPTKDMEP